MLMTKNAKIVWQQKKVPPAIIPEKAIILHTLEDAGIYMCAYMCTHVYIYIYTHNYIYVHIITYICMQICYYII